MKIFNVAIKEDGPDRSGPPFITDDVLEDGGLDTPVRHSKCNGGLENPPSCEELGKRLKFHRGTQFRGLTNSELRELIVTCFVMDWRTEATVKESLTVRHEVNRDVSMMLRERSLSFYNKAIELNRAQSRARLGTNSALSWHQVSKQPESQPELRPESQVTPPVAPPVAVIVLVRLIGSVGPLGNSEILANLGLSDRTHLREHYIDPALANGLVERTIPNKPTSRLQKYRLTEKGLRLLEQLDKEGGRS